MPRQPAGNCRLNWARTTHKARHTHKFIWVYTMIHYATCNYQRLLNLQHVASLFASQCPNHGAHEPWITLTMSWSQNNDSYTASVHKAAFSPTEEVYKLPCLAVCLPEWMGRPFSRPGLSWKRQFHNLPHLTLLRSIFIFAPVPLRLATCDCLKRKALRKND